MGVGRVLFNTLLLTVGIIGLSFVDTLHPTVPQLAAINGAAVEWWSLVRPGGQLHPADFIEHQGHLVVEGCLLLVIIYLLFQSSYQPTANAEAPLTEKEIDELCEEWEPEPLYGQLTQFQKQTLEPLVVSGDVGPRTVVNGEEVLNMAAMNFLGLAGNEEVRAACHQTISKYGVGSCGPRGFYGTIDVHLHLEERIAKFMGTQEAILYSYDLATMPSIIPAFANKKDFIIVDDGCSYAIQNGCHLSRARVLKFKHNDVADLERILKQIAAEDKKYKRPLNRRFIVVEGIYANTGDVAPLAAIKPLKEKYKYRLVIDESISLGVLGENGRGAAEESGFEPMEDVEIIGASIGNSIASIGGFCAGDREIVDHQRLSGLGYCFSASLPPYLASAAIIAFDILDRQGAQLMSQVRSNARRFRKLASTIPGLVVIGSDESADSPLIHLQLHPTPAKSDYDAGDLKLQLVAEKCLQDGVLFNVSKYSMLERDRPPPSIRVAVSAAHSSKDIEEAVAVLKTHMKGSR